MFTATGVLMITLLPAGVAVGVLLLGCKLRPVTKNRACLEGGVGALSVGAAYIAAHLARHGWPAADSWRQLEAWQWVFWLASAATVLALANGVVPGRAWSRWGLRIGLIATGLIVLLQPYWQHTWGSGTSVAWITGLATGFAVFWALVDRSGRHIEDTSWSFGVTTVCLGTGLVLLLTGSQRLSELGIVLTAAMGVMATAGLKPALRPLLVGVSGVFPVILGSLWLNAYFYSETSGATVLLLALALSAVWIDHLPPLARLGAAKLAAVRIGAVLTVVLVAVVPLIL